MADYLSNDTIAAIATSMAGDGGVGIIRISGKDAYLIAKQITKSDKKFIHRKLIRTKFHDLKSNYEIDDGLTVYFKQGHSFTGEDTIEMHLHGGRIILQNILFQILSTGKARSALPGEFSFRALKNGKLDLTRAEAIKQMIDAKSLYEIETIRNNISNKHLAAYEALREKIHKILIKTELSIDFSDQDVEVIALEEITNELNSCVQLVNELLEHSKNARRIAKGIRLTITGEPNAGKSTIFNALLAEERAIVSDIAGTTRDIISEELHLGKLRVLLFDTAGIRDTNYEIEKEGIKKAEKLLRESDQILLIIDNRLSNNEIIKQIEKFSKYNDQLIVVFNKIDLDSTDKSNCCVDLKSVKVSAINKESINHLISTIKTELESKAQISGDDFLPSEFQFQMLTRSAEALRHANELIQSTSLRSPELISSKLNEAAQSISDLVGKTTPDDILSRIFSEFCIGK